MLIASGGLGQWNILDAATYRSWCALVHEHVETFGTWAFACAPKNIIRTLADTTSGQLKISNEG